MDSSLINDDNDGGSVSSQRSTSLLERIRMQQNRQKQDVALPTSAIQFSTSNENNNMIGNNHYNSTPMDSVSSSNENFQGGSNFFSQAWNNLSQSMALSSSDDGMNDALLAPTSTAFAPIPGAAPRASDSSMLLDAEYGEHHYSMGQYFITFVRDVYDGFMSCHVYGRVLIVLVLMYVAWKLL
jgi:hypothetical protein